MALKRMSCGSIAASSKCSGRMPTITSRWLTFRPAGIGASPNGSRSLPSSSVAGTKFIAGEPMKPATNRLSGFA